MHIKVICTVILLSAIVHGGPAIGESVKPVENLVHPNGYHTVEESLMKKLNTKCIDRDISSCMMLKLVTYVNRFLKKSTIEIGDVEIKQTSVEMETEESGRSLDVDKMPEDAQLYEVIANKFANFVRTRSLKWKVTEDTDVVVSTNTKNDGSLNLELSLKPSEGIEGEARKKKNQGLGAILALAALKIGLLKGLALKALALLVGKALLVSKLALVLAAVIGLKKLFHQEKHVTYEVVAHPHHEHHEHHEVSGGAYEHGGHSWGRNFNAAELAYRAHKPSH
ncbi:uncharacterized protein LOC108742906 [Agrilus planipennis]|uniref:Uncharacterized protein LOC108742906 n=1 Tax=Agrilus planipennis TaxID=224129 RepID=A0A1W4XMR0_AGRPL|nr:uncharacterized protein LOC108742906 [Agrilus planipennis]